jgi:hypothetical protein
MSMDKNASLVTVFDTETESEAMVVQGLLEAAGIGNVFSSLDYPQGVIPAGGVCLKVTEADADKARQVIEEYRESADDDPDPYGDFSEFSEGARP